ncbi:MAG: DUF1638 domain-containing protein [Verrucomicrobiota bacterium]
MFLKVIACEIAVREICFVAAQAEHVVDLEFLPQGHHDNPTAGRDFIQERVNAVPEGKYDAILLGYGLCGNIIAGLKATHTPLVIPRAHDCITFFLGSHERYQHQQDTQPGAYFYTAGWLECIRRRGDKTPVENAMFLPTRTGLSQSAESAFEEWVKRYGEDQAKYLMEVMGQWTASYSHGVLIEFEFTKLLPLREQVQAICAKRGWQFANIEGDLGLLQQWLNGEWDPKRFLVVHTGGEVIPCHDETVITVKPGA